MSLNNETTLADTTFHAGLVLVSGSKAGLVAPMTAGYYAIGRDAECQIRPKSRSVSRFHCLVLCSEEAVKVMDLDSTSGTVVGDQRLTPKRWVEIRDGQRLRCGKIAFDLRLSAAVVHSDSADNGSDFERGDHDDTAAGHDGAGDTATDSPRDGGFADDSRVLPTGAALSEDSIADFLVLADDQDRQDRYQKIIDEKQDDDRVQPDTSATGSTLTGSAASDSADLSADEPSDWADDTMVSETDGDFDGGDFESGDHAAGDHAAGNLAGGNLAASSAASVRGVGPDRSKTDSAVPEFLKPKKPVGGSRSKPKEKNLAPKKRKKKKRSPPSVSTGGYSLQSIAVTIVCIVAFGFLAFRAYQSFFADNVRVIRNIDG